MKRKQVRLSPRSVIPIIFSLVLLIALAVSTLAQAAPSNQPFIPIYEMTVSPLSVQLCVGETEIIDVYVKLEINADMDGFYYSGEKVSAVVVDDQVGTISPPSKHTDTFLGGRGSRSVGPSLLRRLQRRQPQFNDAMYLEFYFTADKKGETTIEFKHEASARSYPRALPQTVQVKVIDCYEGKLINAFHTNWIQKEICALDHPFTLRASLTLPESQTNFLGISNLGNYPDYRVTFTPSELPISVGLPELQTGDFSTWAKLESVAGTCTETSSGGTYQLEPHGQGESDLLMTGTHTQTCCLAGFCYTTTFPNTETRILIKTTDFSSCSQ
jgi:hypothetical protein